MNAAEQAGPDATSDAGSEAGNDGGTDAPATVRIVGGNATPEEAAAVLVVLTALRDTALRDTALRDGAAPPDQGASRSLWNSRARAARPRLSPGPGAWRGSALPR